MLGSFNLVKYLKLTSGPTPFETNVVTPTTYSFDIDQLKQDIPIVVRAMDNIIENTTYPLKAQEIEAKNKRRMGLGVTGVANAGEILGYEYASESFIKWLESTMEIIRDEVYNASIELAKEKGPFPLFDSKKYCQGEFIKTLPENIQRRIKRHGIRNSHLLSIAPTGTISLSADNVSSGIEPVFSLSLDRTIQTFDGPTITRVDDYAYRVYGVKGKTTEYCSAEDHLNVLATAQRYVDSAVSKTINVNPTMPWQDFKDIYLNAWKLGCKGVTTFNSGGKRFGILNAVKEKVEGAEACYIDPNTGKKTCE